MKADLRVMESHPQTTAAHAPAAGAPAPPTPVPADRWTWRTTTGRALSAVTGAAAFGTGLALGGAVGWTFWTALIAPDVALFHRGATPPAGPGRLSPDSVRFYNTLHDPRLAGAVVAAGVLTANRPLLLAGLGWTTHIAVDRAFGFGFRRPDGAIH
ncbi:DUF4260 family protein [Streptomyces sp. NPDC058257]|uniref:DUF4260 family protein n=1 Tax=Streptomyces sp. NPDC058257 TaxID=3346409 RepID=UPI0036E78DC7